MSVTTVTTVETAASAETEAEPEPEPDAVSEACSEEETEECADSDDSEEPEETEENRQKPTETDKNPTKAYKDKDKDKDIDIKENPLKGVKEKPSRFSPPSVEEVRAYCQERGNKVDPEAFVAFYESKGWKIGNTPMKSWKASVITWEKRETTRAAPVKKVVAQQYEQRDYSGIQDELMEQQDREMEEYLRKEREKGANNNAESNSTADVLPDDSEWLFNGTG
jgi:hypothetical protein